MNSKNGSLIAKLNQEDLGPTGINGMNREQEHPGPQILPNFSSANKTKEETIISSFVVLKEQNNCFNVFNRTDDGLLFNEHISQGNNIKINKWCTLFESKRRIFN